MAEPKLSSVGVLAQQGDPDRFKAAICASESARERMFAVIALNVEIAKIPVTVSEPLLGEIRLQWWIDAVEDLCDGKAVRDQEIVAALSGDVRDKDLLLALINARRFDIHDLPMQSDQALDDYLTDTGGAIAQLMASRNEVVAKVGWAEAAGRLIEALPALYHHGISAIPVEGKLDLNAIAEGKTPDNLRAAVSQLAGRGLSKLANARAERKKAQGDALAACMSAHIYEPTLRAAAAPDFNIFTSPVRPSPFRANLNFLVRAVSGRW
ncbi:MAG: phytoene/squalene synthase family protein [Pikeienuella sp.]